MTKTISLPFIGDFKHSQRFGVRPQTYAKFGLKGHDGDDWLMPEKTKIISPLNGIIQEVKFDRTGWGHYLFVWDKQQNLLVNLAHNKSINVHIGDVVKIGDEVARSGNSGNSSAPHLHMALADTGADGKRLFLGNGYRGWYSVFDGSRVQVSAGAPKRKQLNLVSSAAELVQFGRWMDLFDGKLDRILEQTKP